MYIHKHMYIYICIFTHIYIFTNRFVFIYIYSHILYIYIYIFHSYIYTLTHIYIYIFTYIYLYIYILAYTHIYIYIHIIPAWSATTIPPGQLRPISHWKLAAHKQGIILAKQQGTILAAGHHSITHRCSPGALECWRNGAGDGWGWQWAAAAWWRRWGGVVGQVAPLGPRGISASKLSEDMGLNLNHVCM